MNVPIARNYRLVQRGGPGPSCDEDGIALGPISLLRRLGGVGDVYWGVSPLDELREILEAAYGPQPTNIVERCHRGLGRAAHHLERGDAASAALEAVTLGLPGLTPNAMAELANVAVLRKWGDSWQNQPRVPTGQPGGGQWTSEGGGDPSSNDDSDAPRQSSAPAREDKPSDGGGPQPRQDISLRPDDLVFRPSEDHPLRVLIGGAEDEEPRTGFGGNRPPTDYTTLQEIFPGLKDHPGVAIPLAPVDAFLGIGSAADEANLAVTMLQYNHLVAEIRSLDPSWHDYKLMPAGGIAAMPWQGRNNLLNDLRFQRAAAYYRVRGDIAPLQVETLRYLQQTVDQAYRNGVQLYQSGRLSPRLSPQEAIGNYVDQQVRTQLRWQFSSRNVPYGPSQNITVNNRDPSTPDQTYKVPDLRLGDVSFDWTLSPKSISDAQIRGFFRADSNPIAVVIVRPSQLGPNSTYLIPRPANVRKGAFEMAPDGRWFIPNDLSEVYDFLGWMMLCSPRFDHSDGYLPPLGIENAFVGLNEGLRRIESQLGEDRYRQLTQMSDQMRTCFEADPDDKLSEAIQGRDLILDMQEMLKAVARGD